MIVIVDYGMGNLGSIRNMLKRVGFKSIISSDPAEIASAEKIILPGVGAFDNGISSIESRGLRKILDKKALEEKTPILGICLGMQLMTKRSGEGVLPGLCWVDAETIRFSFPQNGLKVPHMGWNTCELRKQSPLFVDMPGDMRFYFVHSYRVVCKRRQDVLAETDYGGFFASAFQKDNIFGVQFHPEKSHKFGMQLLKNFAEME